MTQKPAAKESTNINLLTNKRMIVTQQTISTLAARGVIIRPTFYDFAEYLQKEWERCFNYCPTCTPERERREMADKWIADKDRRARRWWESSNALFIADGSAIYEMKNLPAYKETTLQDIEKRIERERKKYRGTYGEFCRKMQKLLHDEQITCGFSIYPTTYGIGILVIYNWHAAECVALVAKAMKIRGIEYSNEYSEAKWVYRFKVSKKADNLQKL